MAQAAEKRGDEVGESLKPGSGSRDFEVSSRLYSDATKDDFKAEIEEVKKDNPSAATIVYDERGEVKSFTFDNKRLYDKNDPDLPKKLATETVVEDIRRRDVAAAQSDKIKVAKTFGFDAFDVQDRVLKQVAIEESAKMGANLKDGNLPQVYQDLQGLKQLYPNPKELQSFLESATRQSGLPADSAVVSNNNGKLSFKVNGQEMMGDKAPEFTPPSTGERTGTPTKDTPRPPDADIVAVRPEADVAVTPKADAPVEPKEDAPVEPKVDAPVEPKADAPVEPKADAPLEPKADAPADQPPAAEREPEKVPPQEAPESNLDAQAKAQYETKLREFYANKNESLPVRAGEGYYQVLDRMHPEMSPREKVQQSRRLRDLNGPELRVGQRFAMSGQPELEEAVAATKAIYEKATPEEREAMLADITQEVAKQNELRKKSAKK